MRFFISLLICIFLTSVVVGRPSNFESDMIVTDQDGFYRSSKVRRSNPDPQDMLDYTVRFHPHVIMLDRIRHIESIVCQPHGDLTIEVTAGAQASMWNSNDVLFGGKEWGCVDDRGKPSRFAVRPTKMYRKGDVLFIMARHVEQEEVYETLKIDWSTPPQMQDTHLDIMKRTFKEREFNHTASWNIVPKETKAEGPVHLVTLDCKSPVIKNMVSLKAICATGAKVKVEVTCVDCWARFKLGIVFKYDLNSTQKDLTTVSTIKMNMSVEVKSTVAMTYDFPNAFSASAPFITLGIPAIADIDISFVVAVDVTLKWNIIGAVTVGAEVQGDYVMSVGSNDRTSSFNLTPEFHKPLLASKGEGSVETTLRAGPHFQIHLLTKTFFDAFTEIAPFSNFKIQFDPLTMPPKTDVGKKALVKAPWMTSACTTRHLVEWGSGLGVKVNVGAKGPLVPDSWNKNYVWKTWDLADGCMFAV